MFYSMSIIHFIISKYKLNTVFKVVLEKINRVRCIWRGPANLNSVLGCMRHQRMDTKMARRWNFSDNFKATVALNGLCAETRLCRRQEAPSEGLCVGSR